MESVLQGVLEGFNAPHRVERNCIADFMRTVHQFSQNQAEHEENSTRASTPGERAHSQCVVGNRQLHKALNNTTEP